MCNKGLIFTGTIGLCVLQGDLKADPLDNWFNRTADKPVGMLNGVVWGGGQFVAVGNGIVTSPDGIAWTTETNGTDVGLKGVAWGNDLYVAVGLNKRILSSPDGANWTKQSSVDPALTNSFYDYLGVGFGTGLFVAVGKVVQSAGSESGPRSIPPQTVKLGSTAGRPHMARISISCRVE